MDFIYLNSNSSGIGDRLIDLMLIYTYSKFLNCNNLYLYWNEDNNKIMGDNKSIHSKTRYEKTSFRSSDYLLKNLINYIIFPDDIHFVTKQKLQELANNINSIKFEEYMGCKYTLYSFMERIPKVYQKNFEKNYFNNFNKIKFKNIPEEITEYFKKNDIITIHLRRGDKVVSDGGTTNNIDTKDLDKLNMITLNTIDNLIKLNYKNFYFVSDEKCVVDYYLNLYKDKVNCIKFYGDNISQTYYDMFALVNSQKIILSQAFSAFSIFCSLIKQNELYSIINHSNMNKFLLYKNINFLDNYKVIKTI